MANIFPRWTNYLPIQLLIALGFLGAGVAAGVTYYFTPKYTNVGYQPTQPIPFSHKIHAGDLKMDCQYCHSYVGQSGVANVPSSNTCWNCHQHVKTNSPHIQKIKDSVETGKPIEWVKIHKVPDYAAFNHSIHVNSGVSCVSCHGKINEMTVVHQDQNLSMGWCLDCHRNPEPHLRPLDKVTKLDWKPEDSSKDPEKLGADMKKALHIHPPEDCSACHR